MPDRLILGFDTSAAHCAAVLLWEEQVIAARHEDMAKGQAERLMPLLQELLRDADADWGDVIALGVGIGPGNFTGIRIAVSAARGLALSLSIPAIGVSNLEAMAVGFGGPVLCTLDARRGQYYAQVFNVTEPQGPVLCDSEALPWPQETAGLAVMGHDAEALADSSSAQVVQPAYTVADAVARVARQRMDLPGLSRPVPLYLRGADAAPPREAAPVILP